MGLLLHRALPRRALPISLTLAFLWIIYILSIFSRQKPVTSLFPLQQISKDHSACWCSWAVLASLVWSREVLELVFPYTVLYHHPVILWSQYRIADPISPPQTAIRGSVPPAKQHGAVWYHQQFHGVSAQSPRHARGY